MSIEPSASPARTLRCGLTRSNTLSCRGMVTRRADEVAASISPAREATKVSVPRTARRGQQARGACGTEVLVDINADAEHRCARSIFGDFDQTTVAGRSTSREDNVRPGRAACASAPTRDHRRRCWARGTRGLLSLGVRGMTRLEALAEQLDRRNRILPRAFRSCWFGSSARTASGVARMILAEYQARQLGTASPWNWSRQ